MQARFADLCTVYPTVTPPSTSTPTIREYVRCCGTQFLLIPTTSISEHSLLIVDRKLLKIFLLNTDVSSFKGEQLTYVLFQKKKQKVEELNAEYIQFIKDNVEPELKAKDPRTESIKTIDLFNMGMTMLQIEWFLLGSWKRSSVMNRLSTFPLSSPSQNFLMYLTEAIILWHAVSKTQEAEWVVTDDRTTVSTCIHHFLRRFVCSPNLSETHLPPKIPDREKYIEYLNGNTSGIDSESISRTLDRLTLLDEDYDRDLDESYVNNSAAGSTSEFDKFMKGYEGTKDFDDHCKQSSDAWESFVKYDEYVKTIHVPQDVITGAINKMKEIQCPICYTETQAPSEFYACKYCANVICKSCQFRYPKECPQCRKPGDDAFPQARRQAPPPLYEDDAQQANLEAQERQFRERNERERAGREFLSQVLALDTQRATRLSQLEDRIRQVQDFQAIERAYVGGDQIQDEIYRTQIELIATLMRTLQITTGYTRNLERVRLIDIQQGIETVQERLDELQAARNDEQHIARSIERELDNQWRQTRQYQREEEMRQRELGQIVFFDHVDPETREVFAQRQAQREEEEDERDRVARQQRLARFNQRQTEGRVRAAQEREQLDQDERMRQRRLDLFNRRLRQRDQETRQRDLEARQRDLEARQRGQRQRQDEIEREARNVVFLTGDQREIREALNRAREQRALHLAREIERAQRERETHERQVTQQAQEEEQEQDVIHGVSCSIQ